MPDEDPQVGGRVHAGAGAARGSDASVQGASAGCLLVCATPIGNLKDVTLRVLEALARADVVACEDTRHTRRLLERHGIARGELVSFHEHNERRRAAELVARMRAGATVALVSDAGTPLISDPGYELVRASIAVGLAVEALPGPSAAVSALVASGLPAERWCFVGFLPRGGAAARRRELASLLARSAGTTIAFESPRRLAATLALLAELDPARPVAVCRELTKLHEEIRRGSAAELAEHYTEHSPRGEIVLAIGTAGTDRAHSAVSEEASPAGAHAARVAGVEAIGSRREEALGAVRELVQAGAKPRRAAAVVAKLTGLATNELYGELVNDA
jgi:16S rRNA (cytidine1402-2'-O)-methyltransferase